MKTTLAYVLRDCTAWLDNDSKLGQVPEMTIAKPREITEKFRNGGMIKERTVAMGYELSDLSVKMTGVDPHTQGLMTGKPGTENTFMFAGALVDEDGTVHQAVYTSRGRLIDPSDETWAPGQKSEGEYKITQNYARFEIDGAEIWEIDDFDYSVNGESQRESIRAALMV
ncbi:phage major tail tube protein [Tropicimonas sp. IMCC34043]|uniref:phage major tail tube protein n=1 Tax=Tropicimonas sp. IMCC34043 TaxID=2248760 RepID=UPI000E242E9F|nr:phage major tail tube protein [Tropicimonas sp. IMCC34043]